MRKPNAVADAAMMAMLAELVLDDALRTFRVGQLYKQIDAALAGGDRAAFRRLTDELKPLLAAQRHKSP